jgi:superfamily I DNA/RNA helicase
MLKGKPVADAAREKAALEMTSVNDAIGKPFGLGTPDLLTDLARLGIGDQSRDKVRQVVERGRRSWTVSSMDNLLVEVYREWQQETAGGVSVRTIHSAKGREWDHVFVPGCEEGTFPSHGKAGADLEEERRLMYVAATRSFRQLTLSWCAMRRDPWNRALNARSPSRFIMEMGFKP